MHQSTRSETTATHKVYEEREGGKEEGRKRKMMEEDGKEELQVFMMKKGSLFDKGRMKTGVHLGFTEAE